MINRVVLVGRLTRDPELKYTTNNIANLRFTVAVNRQFSNQNGERQADFIGCVAWRAQAENMARFLKKGSLIGVEGRIETGSYQGQDGQMRYTTDVIADSVQFLEPRGAQTGGGAQPGFGGSDSFSGFPTGGSGVPSNSFPNGGGSGQQSNPFPSGSGQQSNPFPSGNNAMDTNPFPSNANTSPNNNNVPDFNSTIDISDDDLPF